MAGGLLTVRELLWWLWLLCVSDLGVWCAGLPSVDGNWGLEVGVPAAGVWICEGRLGRGEGELVCEGKGREESE